MSDHAPFCIQGHRKGVQDDANQRGRNDQTADLFCLARSTRPCSGRVVVMLFALQVFAYIKGMFTTAWPFRSAWQTVIVGGLTATAAFVIAKAIGYTSTPTSVPDRERYDLCPLK